MTVLSRGLTVAAGPVSEQAGAINNRVLVILARLLGAFVIAVGGLVLVGWVLDSAVLRGVAPGLVAMNPTTAAAFIMAGASLLFQREAAGARRRRIGRALALAIVLIALIKLAGLVGWDAGIDRLLFPTKLDAYTPPNRMAPNTAANFLLIGLALWLLEGRPPARDRAQPLAALAGLVGLFAVAGYAYGVNALYGLASYIPMALNTALGFVVLSVGVLCARADRGPAALLTRHTSGGLLARRLLPAAVGIPAVLGWLCLQGERAGLYDTAFGVALLVIATIVLLVLLVWRTLQSLDLTDARRRRAEAERAGLAAEAERERATLAAVMASMNDGLMVADAADRVRFCNAGTGRLLGIAPRAAIGRSPRDVFEGLTSSMAEPDVARAVWGQALDHPGEQASGEIVLTAPAPRDISVRVFPVVDTAGAGLGQAIVLRDVTAERELARAKDELVGVVSHELRTPMASLVGFAELLLTRDFDEPERREFLGIMLAEGRRLTSLINDFLDLQRMESGRQVLAIAPTDPRALLERAVAASGNDPDRPVSLEIDGALPLVLADADQVHQVLTNLLSNARKYSPDGGEVCLTARVVGRELAVAVRDQGLGIPPDALDRLFEKFYRVDSSDRRDIGGTGLGLAICRRIVAAHGGHIWAESAGPGHGTTMHFTLPLVENESPAGDVLIVEDDRGFGRLLEAELAARGLTSVWVGSGEAALELVGAHPPRAVVLDLLLPGMQGDAVLPRLHEAAGRRIPVVVVSSSDIDPAARQALDTIGVGTVLRKEPGVAARAAEAVDRALGGAPFP